MRLIDNVRASLSTIIGCAAGPGVLGGIAKALTPVDLSLTGKTFIGTTTSLLTGGTTLALMLLHPESVKTLGELSVMATTAVASAYVAVGTGLAYAVGGGLGTKTKADKKPALVHRPF